MTMLRTTRTRLFHVALATALTGTLTACTFTSGSQAGGDLLSKVKQAGILRVALTEANPPWNFLDSSNQPVGYDVDVAKELAKRLTITTVQFVPSSFQNFIEGVRADRFDIVISGQTITEERKKQVHFSRPYEVNGISVFTKSSNSSIQGISDLAGTTIAVSAGTTQEAYVRTKIPQATAQTYQNATLGLTDLGRGNADAMLVSRFQGSYLANKNNLEVKPVGPLLESEVNGMSFRQGSGAFKLEVERVIGEMVNDGTLTRISEKWLGGLDMAAELKKLPAS
jgi:ABC-type amino acid transport substrate-binding protein